MEKVVLTIGGLDAWGGGGLSTDIAAINSSHAFPLSVATCIATLGHESDFDIHPIDSHLVKAQLETIQASFKLDAIKIGLLPNLEIIDLVTQFVQKQGCPLVIDPVMAFKETSKRHLYCLHALENLIRIATLVTPNIPEAEILLSKQNTIKSKSDLIQAAQNLFTKYQVPFLVKGGGRLRLTEENETFDAFYGGQESQLLKGTRIHTLAINGAGCALSSLLASYLSQDYQLDDAIHLARTKTNQAIRHGILHSQEATGNVWVRQMIDIKEENDETSTKC